MRTKSLKKNGDRTFEFRGPVPVFFQALKQNALPAKVAGKGVGLFRLA